MASMTSGSSSGFCLVQGSAVDTVALTDRGLAYGDGLFETMRMDAGQVPAWPLHRDRLSRGAAVLGMEIPWPALEQQFEQAVALAEAKAIGDGVLKLIITRGSGGEGYKLPIHPVPTLIFIGRPYRPMHYLQHSTAVRLKSCNYRLAHNPALAGIKHLNRLEQVLAAASVNLAPGEQGLVLDKDGRVIETLHHNIFLIAAGRLRTPDLSFCGVAGVLRRALLEFFATDLGIAAAVEHLDADDLLQADEVFICNGVHGITPVHQWQDRRWQTGPMTEALTRQVALKWKNLYGS